MVDGRYLPVGRPRAGINTMITHSPHDMHPIMKATVEELIDTLFNSAYTDFGNVTITLLLQSLILFHHR
jgi:hypothetical protein